MRKALLVLVVLGLLSGCRVTNNQPTYDLELVAEQVEVSDQNSACYLVRSVNQVTVKEDMIDSTHILLPTKQQVDCNRVDLSQLGKKKLRFVIGNEVIEKTIEVVDSISPEIESEQEYVVEVGNQYFNLKQLVHVTDNYDESVSLQEDGYLNLNQVGEYPVKLIAIDTSGNRSEKEVLVKVIEKEKEVIIKEVEVEVKPSESTPTTTTTQPSPSPQPQPEPQPEPSPSPQPQPHPDPQPAPPAVTPKSKYFAFSDYGSFDVTMSACNQWITQNKHSSQNASCTPVSDGEGIYIGYQGEIY